MSDPSGRVPGDDDQAETSPSPGEAFKELRELLVAPEREQLRKLEKRMSIRLHAKEIGRHLPEAVVLSTKEDRRLSTALMPTVEEIIRSSVKKDRKIFANALFPVIGPAIRKSIAETFRNMIQSLNQTLENSLSWDGFKWRLEAARTGKSFAEVVLLHSLVYRVEQAFLIHGETGLVLQHAAAEAVAFQDADMVSGMLTAIQDFTRDSFNTPTDDTLETIEVGELTVWIEQGPFAHLAAVIRGNAPGELRSVLRDTLENIHLEMEEELEAFDGDAEPFNGVRHHVESCLKAHYRAGERRFSPLLWLFLGVLVVGLGLWAFFSMRDHMRWQGYIDALAAEQGIVVVSAERGRGRYAVSGLRDPLARDPVEMVRSTKIDPDKVTHQWEPYQALSPGLIRAWAERILDPPRTVTIRVEEGELVLVGMASHRWVVEARKLGRFLPGVTGLRDEGLVDVEMRALDRSKERIEGRVLLFPFESAELSAGQEKTVEALRADLEAIAPLAESLRMDLNVEVVGHADSFGSEEVNLKLSWMRAEHVHALLIESRFPVHRLSTVGVGENRPVYDENTMGDRTANRCVSFRVTLAEDGREDGKGP